MALYFECQINKKRHSFRLFFGDGFCCTYTVFVCFF